MIKVTKKFHYFWWPVWILSFAGAVTYPYDIDKFWNTAGAITLIIFLCLATASLSVSLQ